jgi:hypothetical protein
MAEKTIPPSDPRYTGGLANMANMNVEGANPEDIQTIRDATDEAIKALQDRYANPNWFKVSAAFGKPQLGGFAASLGSAAEALGENVEQQRENILPIANMKIAREQQNLLLNQKIKQRDIYDKWLASKEPMDASTYQTIASLGNSTEIAIAAKQYLDQEQKRLEVTGAAKKLQYEYPELDKSLLNVIPDSPEAYQAQMDKLNKAKPPQTQPETWAAMTPNQKKDEVAVYADKQRQKGMDQEQISEDIAIGSMQRLKLLRTARELASDTEMAPVFAVLNKADAMSLIKKITDEVGGNSGAVMQGLQNAIRSQYTTENDPDGTKRAKADLLFKTIARIAAENRNSAKNPTNAFQELSQAGSPGLDNSQQGFLGIIDQMGLAEKRNVDLHNLRIRSGVPSRLILDSPESQALEAKYDKEAESLLKSNPYSREPSWYKGSTVTIPSDAKMQKSEDVPNAPAPVKAQAPRSSIGKAISKKLGREE